MCIRDRALIRGAFAKETKSAADAKKPEAAKTGAEKPADGKERPKLSLIHI